MSTTKTTGDKEMKQIYALVAFEESQTVTKALRELGVIAYSNDLKPTSGENKEWHLQMDCVEAIKCRKWDLIIMHPPCTYMTVAGNRHYAKGKEKHQLRIDACKFTQNVWDLATSVCDFVAMENPVGCLSTMCNLPKAQYIQPYEYGNPARKKTGLWLKGLPRLERTHFDVAPEIIEYTRGDGRKTTFSMDYIVGVDRSGAGSSSTKRSKTYPGIAKAMAEQWCKHVARSKFDN